MKPKQINRIQKIARFLVSIEIWIVGLAIVSSVLSANLLPYVVLVCAIFWPLRWLAYGRLTLRTPVDWPILLLLLMLPVTIWATAIPATTLPQVYRLMTGVATFYAIVNWAATSTRLRWLGFGLVVTGLLLALSAPLSVDWSTNKFSSFLAPLYSHFTILVSDTVNPNVMAGSLVILLPVVLAWLLFSWQDMQIILRITLTLVLVLILAILGLTLARGAWIALGVVAVIFTLLRWKRGWIPVLLGGVGVIAGVLWLGFTPIMNALLVSGTVNTVDGRLELWSRALYMIQDFPFTGVGMGNFGPVADAMYPFFFIGPGIILHAHNLFLQVAVDLGIPGLVAWLSILLTISFISLRLYQIGLTTHQGLAIVLGAGLLCSQVALAVHGLTDAVTWGIVRSAPIVWAIWGVTAASWNFFSNHKIEPPLAD